MSHLLSTQTVRPQERLTYWVDAVCSTYVPIDCAVRRANRFMDGSIDVRDLDLVELTITRSRQQTIHRTPKLAARSDSDYFLLQMPITGACAIEQAGRRAVLGHGDFTIYDCTRPFDIIFPEDFEMRLLKIPRSLLLSRHRRVDQLTAVRVGAETGAGELIRSIFDQIYDGRTPIASAPSATACLADALLNIVAAGLSTLAQTRDERLPQLTAFHLERARRHIHACLADPELSPESIAAALGLSRAQLHRVFKAQGQSVMQYVWACRLEQSREALTRPHLSKRSISEIAFGFGFSDVSHFYRSFRRAFGVAPREWRLAALEASGAGGDASQRPALPLATGTVREDLSK